MGKNRCRMCKRRVPSHLLGWRYGEHLDVQRSQPLCNLYLSMLQWMGSEQASSNRNLGTLAGLRLASESPEGVRTAIEASRCSSRFIYLIRPMGFVTFVSVHMLDVSIGVFSPFRICFRVLIRIAYVSH